MSALPAGSGVGVAVARQGVAVGVGCGVTVGAGVAVGTGVTVGAGVAVGCGVWVGAAAAVGSSVGSSAGSSEDSSVASSVASSAEVSPEAGDWTLMAAATAASMVAWILGVGGGTAVGVLAGVSVGWAWQAAMMDAAIRIRGRRSIAFNGKGRDSPWVVALMYSKAGYTPGSYSGSGRRGHSYRL